MTYTIRLSIVFLAIFPTISLGLEKDDQLARELSAIVRDGRANVFTRIEAAQAIGKLGVKGIAAIPDLIIQLGKFRPNELPNLQEAIIQSLGQLGNAAIGSLPALTKLSGQNIDLDRAIKATIAQILAAPENIDTVVLIQQLRNADASLRLRAAKALSELGTNGRVAINELTNALSDPDADVRRAALTAIKLIQPNQKPTEAMIRVYIQDLTDPDDLIRFRAAKTLGRMGPAATSALQALEAAANDPDRDVRRAIAEAMAKINP